MSSRNIKMLLHLFSLSVLACLAHASPISSPLHVSALNPIMTDYFSSINVRRHSPTMKAAMKALKAGSPVVEATCEKYDLSSAAMPMVSGLPGPSDGLKPYHVVLGRGVQNYTCASATATPTPKGALATLYNISCAAAVDSTDRNSLTASMVPAAYEYPETSSGPLPQFNNPIFNISGHHYFSDDKTPTFNLVMKQTGPPPTNAEIPLSNYGIYFAKVSDKAAAAPTLGNESTSRGRQAAVPWLKLSITSPAPTPYKVMVEDQKSAKEIFRVNTVGGNANAGDCANHADGKQFSVPYAAEYWFWG